MEYTPTEEQDEEMQLVPLLRLCFVQFVRNWKWFLLSVIVCLAAGWYYQQSQPRVYKRQSVMLIEDASSSSSTMSRMSKRSSGMSTLMELNGVSVGDNLKDEMFILSSQRLMKRVVERLHLDVDYTMTQALHPVSLYGKQRPFEVMFQSPLVEKKSVAFSVSKSGRNSVRISGLHSADGDEVEDIQVQLGQVVNTPAGRLCIVRGANFNQWPEDDAEINVVRMPVDKAVDRYVGRLSTEEYDKETSLIVISFTDINPKRADDVLNTLYDVYREDVLDNKNRVAQSTADFIDNRVKLIGNELGSVENKLADFKKRNKIVDYESSAKAMAAQTLDAHQASLECETQLNVAQFLADYLADHSNDHDLIPALNVGEASFNNQITQYNDLMNQRNRMVENSSEHQSVVRDLDRQLAQMRRTVSASLKSYIGTLRLRLNDARTNESVVTGQLVDAPDKEKEGLDIKRQQALKETLYTYLLQKREEVALQQAMNEANVRIVEGPVGGDLPVAPRTRIILLVSLALGICIPAGVLWLLMTLDVSVHGRKDVERVTSVPILGEVPHIKTEREEEKNIANLSSDAPMVEAFRVLRFGLDFMRGNTQVMMSTSTSPSQGKSFITTNMAMILAMASKRVIVIDADVRKRTLSHGMHVPVGLTSYLSDEHTQLSELIVKDAMGNGVDFIAAGPMPPNPAELLMSPRLEQLINELRPLYDHILIDTTPMCSVADANIVNRVADITLFVIRIGVQNRDFLPTLDALYKEKRFKNLTVVLNDADAARYGEYSYGYGYGYGSSYSASAKNGRAHRVLNKLRNR